MTALGAETDARLDLTRQALRRTAEAWELGMTAAIDHDPCAARRLMRGAAARRSMLRSAHQHLHWDDASRGLTARHRSSVIEVIADLTRINRLLNQLAQTIIAAPDGHGLDPRSSAAVETARRIGTERLDYLAATMPRPEIHRDYIISGQALLEALAELADRAPRRGSTSDICLALVRGLVETSRHASRIA